MDTRIDEIAERIFRLSTFVPDIGPTGFTFNQFLIDDDEPLLSTRAPRHVPPRVGRGCPHHEPRSPALDRLRAPGGGRMRCHEPLPGRRPRRGGGPRGHGVHGLAQRPRRPPACPPRRWAGARAGDGPCPPHRHAPCAARMGGPGALRGVHRHPVVRRPPHAARRPPALTTDDVVPGAVAAEDLFRASCLGPASGPTVRSLADLAPSTLAIMHSSSFSGDGAGALHALADDYDRRLAAASA